MPLCCPYCHKMEKAVKRFSTTKSPTKCRKRHLRLVKKRSNRLKIKRSELSDLVNNSRIATWCRRPDLNRHDGNHRRILSPLRLPIPPLRLEAPIRIELMIKVLQTSALPLGYGAVFGAGDGIRTRDIRLGKAALYH
jgi:hypothetical protein